MLLWFLFLGISGTVQIVQTPKVLLALNPCYAWHVMMQAGPTVVFLLAAVVLAITGVEALYADMGHFGRRAIARAWNFIVLPCLVLNYLGQAGIALKHPEASKTGMLFFLQVPHGIATIALIILATLATVIASQALISGVFSLTAQARDLGCIPRFLVKHTNRFERGQVYLPSINWILAAACLRLVMTFRSSSNLAAAYGLAVIGTMLITSTAFSFIITKVWHRPVWMGTGVLLLLLSIELPFFFSSLTKLIQGGFFPLSVALCITAIMLTWHKGKALIHQKMHLEKYSLEILIANMASEKTFRIPGTQVIINSNSEPYYAAAHACEWMRRGGALRQQVILMSLVGTPDSSLPLEKSIEVHELAPSLWHVISLYGYMQEVHIPNIMKLAVSQIASSILPEEAFYLLPRETIIGYTGKEMALWQRSLFGWLSRNVSYAPDYFFIPYSQIIEFTWI